MYRGEKRHEGHGFNPIVRGIPDRQCCPLSIVTTRPEVDGVLGSLKGFGQGIGVPFFNTRLNGLGIEGGNSLIGIGV